LDFEPHKFGILNLTTFGFQTSQPWDFETSENNKFRNKSPEIMKMILRSYARNISTEARRKGHRRRCCSSEEN